MRLTEYYTGVAVIKDKALLPKAMEKLAKREHSKMMAPVIETEKAIELIRTGGKQEVKNQ